MDKRQRTYSKFSIVTILSLGSLILGIGSICWALIQIHQQAVPSAVSQYSKLQNVGLNPVATLSSVKQNGLVRSNASSSSSSNQALATSNPNEILYPVRPTVGENIGKLIIPALNQELPIIEGANENELKKGVGHFTQSVLPGENNNSILSGHRDTIFSQLGKLKIGDQLVVQTIAGTFTYQIRNIRIVHKDDKTIIVPTNHAVLTVTTCYPFVYIGDAPDRYVLSADLINRV